MYGYDCAKSHSVAVNWNCAFLETCWCLEAENYWLIHLRMHFDHSLDSANDLELRPDGDNARYNNASPERSDAYNVLFMSDSDDGQ